MALINSIDINTGVMMRAQDIGALKVNQDQRPAVEQFELQMINETERDERLDTIQDLEELQQEEFRFDAREESSNQYQQNRGKKKKKENEESDEEGSFHLKGSGSTFDISI